MIAPSTPRKGTKIKLSPIDTTFNIVIGIILWSSLLVVLYPLVYILSASFSSPTAVLTGRVWLWPVEPSLYSFQAVFRNKQILSGYSNSLIYALGGTLISTSLTLMTAFPLSRPTFYGRKVFLALFLFTMLFSGGLIPTYLLLRDLHMTNTRWAIIIPECVAVWLVIIGKTFFESNIPNELYEAAEIDGCSDFNFFARMVVPLSGPIIAVIALNYAVWLWNSYYSALIYLTDQKKYPLQIILRNILILNQVNISDISDVESLARKQGLAVSLKYALIVVASAPLLIIYPYLQKYFVKGVMVGSVKG